MFPQKFSDTADLLYEISGIVFAGLVVVGLGLVLALLSIFSFLTLTGLAEQQVVIFR